VHIKSQHFWGKFKCKICEFKASFAKDFAGHMEENHKECCEVACPSCRKTFPVIQLESHYKECITQKFKEEGLKTQKVNKVCESCGKTFTWLSAYKTHIKSHLRERLAKGEEGLDESNLFFHCDKCGIVYKRKESLREHMMKEHEKVKFTCPTCSMTFDTRYKVLKHERIAHSTDQKYECKHCGLAMEPVLTNI